MTGWMRHRFQADANDFRPIAWPPPGPYWCSGYAGDMAYSIVIAYTRLGQEVTTWWPEAADIDSEECEEIVFTSRFSEPEWWPEVRASQGG